MYISKIALAKDAALNPENCRIFLSAYSLHQAIWDIFSDHAGRKRDFLYRLDYCSGKPTVYAVSDREPRQDKEMWEIEVKQYAPQILKGEQLAFMLRANPIVSKRNEQKKQARHDVVMEAKSKKRKDDPSGSNRLKMADLIQIEGYNWLTTRSEKYGFEIKPQEVRADSYEQHRFFKGGKNMPVCVSTLDLTGKLAVTDPELFSTALFSGIGPAKGFGCGLMLVKRT